MGRTPMPELVQLTLTPNDQDAVLLPADVQEEVAQALALLLLHLLRAGHNEQEAGDNNHDA